MPGFLASLLAWFRALFRGRRAPLLLIGDLAFARTLPRVFPDPGGRRGAVRRCECGSVYDEVLVTTGGPGSDPEVWRAYPLVVDGWACRACDSVQVPRFLEAEEVDRITEEAQAAHEKGHLDAAEHGLRRVVASWHGYLPGRLNLTLVLRARLQQEQLGAGRGFVELGLLSAIEEQLGVVLTAPPSPERMVAVYRLVDAFAACEQTPRARALLASERARDDLGDEERAELVKIGRYLTQRGDLYQRGMAALEPLLLLDGRPKTPLDEAQRARLTRAIDDLERHLALATDSWQTMFFLGKAEQRREDFEASCAYFQAAAALTDNVDVSRELCGQLLELARNEEALALSKRLVERAPDDAGLHANLAVAQVLVGKPKAARKTVRRALELDPHDAVTRQLQKLVEAYVEETRPLPKSLAEMEGRAPKA